MNMNANAMFLNMVANGAATPCPSCGALNESDARFCERCGKLLPMPAAEPEAQDPDAGRPRPAFAPAQAEPVQKAAPAFAPAQTEPVQKAAPAFAPAQTEPVRKAAPAFAPAQTEPVRKAAPAFAPAQAEPVRKAAPAFAPAQAEPVRKAAPAFAPAQAAPASKAVLPSFDAAEPVDAGNEPESVFAEGLPSWNIEPPQIMVRRKKGK